MKSSLNSGSSLECPHCGSSEILYNEKKCSLECMYCHYLFEDEKAIDDKDEIKDLKGINKSKKSLDVTNDFSDIKTIKCLNCGAEVLVNINDFSNARCQWCRSILSLENSIDNNGIFPDRILPFTLSKEEAYDIMKDFISKSEDNDYKHNLIISNDYKKNFNLDNIVGIYLPYMVVDSNAHVKVSGIGKRLVVFNIINNVVDTYEVEREFDLLVNDLAIESSKDKNDLDSLEKTNNIINSIMPFDMENYKNFNSNYLIGYNSEKRDLNVLDLKNDVYKNIESIAINYLSNDKKTYNYGLTWNEKNIDIIGTKWISYYFPVYLYSYVEEENGKKTIRYIAVNARNGKVNGSISVNKNVLKRKVRLRSKAALYVIVSFFAPIIGLIFAALKLFDNHFGVIILCAIYVLIYFFVRKKILGRMEEKYFHKKDRFNLEKESDYKVTNLVSSDKKIIK